MISVLMKKKMDMYVREHYELKKGGDGVKVS